MEKLSITEVQKKHEQDLMALDGVVGVGIGEDNGEAVILVMVEKKTAELEKRIPKTLEGYRVVLYESGQIRALPQE
ncbi:MAG: hypothetical protein D6743_20370 [Calditrichaeota bacterium]|nr:MAG: hypothetical protein D6743_20370 [Calditrichota bacterium]